MLLCSDHGYTVRCLNTHLRDSHKLSSKERNPILQQYRHHILVNPNDVAMPPHGISPIPYLRVHENGFRCHDCGYLCISRKSIRMHCNRVHKWEVTKQDPAHWTQVRLQTFFNAGYERYFRVASAVAAAEEEDGEGVTTMTAGDIDPIKALLHEADQLDQEERKKLSIIDKKQLLVDLTPWLRKTRWPTYFAGQDLLLIAQMNRLPTKEEGSLKIVCRSIDRIFGHCRKGILDCIDRDWQLLLYWLNGHKEGKASTRPFSSYHISKTISKYVDYWKRFICYCLRAIQEEDQHGVEFLPSQLEALWEIYSMAELDKEDEEPLDTSIFNLSIQFIMQSDYASKKSALIHFTKVLELDGEKIGYRMPKTYTPILSGLIFCMRVLLFEHALPTESRDNL